MIEAQPLSVATFKDGNGKAVFEGIVLYNAGEFLIVKDMDHDKYYFIETQEHNAMDITEEWTQYAEDHEDFAKLVDLTIWYVKVSIREKVPLNPIVPALFPKQIEDGLLAILKAVADRLKEDAVVQDGSNS